LVLNPELIEDIALVLVLNPELIEDIALVELAKGRFNCAAVNIVPSTNGIFNHSLCWRCAC